MKDIHPEFSTETKVACSCGNTFITGSTITTEIKVESCSKCHPFYTGEKRILKTSSVDKFYARQKKSESIAK
ncbi:MAG: 50S ribosomal protein L31 [Candidatus Gracilibacteria bacterium]|nr:50S ribosomal protein L31 [Candidatus Gracilibacteria bacterium]